MIRCLSLSLTQPFLYPTIQLVSQIHWKLPWSHNSTSGGQLGIDYTEGGEGWGGGTCIFQQCACFLPLLFTSPCVISLWALDKMLKSTPMNRSKRITHQWHSKPVWTLDVPPHVQHSCQSCPHRGILLVSCCFGETCHIFGRHKGG